MGRYPPAGLLIGAWATAACGATRSATPEELRVSGATQIITTESTLLSFPVDLALGPTGSLGVLDAAGRVVMVSAQAPPLTVGRAGSGPGEFLDPGSLAIAGDRLYVADVGNLRLQTLTLDGRLQRVARLPGVAVMGKVSIDARGGFLVPTIGLEGVLAQRYDSLGQPAGGFGKPLDSVPRMANPRLTKEQLIGGIVPPLFRNGVLAAAEPDGHVWLVLNGEGRLERFRPDGTRVLSVPLGAREMASVLQEAVDSARATLLNDAGGTYALRYVFDASFDDGVLWLLLNTTEYGPAVLLAVDSSGRTRRRLKFPDVIGARAFAIDKSNRRAYFAILSGASVVRSSLPRGAIESLTGLP